MQHGQAVLSRLHGIFVLGFLVPPALWLPVCVAAGLFSPGEAASIAVNPALVLYIIGFTVGATWLANREIRVIRNRQAADQSHRALSAVQRLPWLFLGLQVLYAAFGPGIGMAGYEFIDPIEYRLSYSVAIPVVSTGIMPFLTLLLDALAVEARHVRLSAETRAMDILPRLLLIGLGGITGALVLATLVACAVLNREPDIALGSFVLRTALVSGSAGLVAAASFFHTALSVSRQAFANEAAALRLAGGDLRPGAPPVQRDEMGVVREALNRLSVILSRSLGRVAEQSHRAAFAAEQESREAEQSSRTLADAEGRSLRFAETARTATERAREAKDAADRGHRTLDELGALLERLEERGDSAGQVLEAIQGIAQQTGLLAINAAVEAARAGGYGRGFAVVADEVGLLAQRSSAAARETAQTVTEVREAVADVRARAQDLGVEFDEILACTSDLSGAVSQAAVDGEAQGKAVVEARRIADRLADAARNDLTAARALVAETERFKILVEPSSAGPR